MLVSRSDPWRNPRDVPYETWKSVIESARNPTGTGERADPQLASKEAWQAARPHSSLALAMLGAESTWGTHFVANPRSNRNPFNLKSPSYDGTYVAFPSWIAGVQGWHDRITSPTYNELSNPGVYAKTVSISDLIHVFAPLSENKTEAYIQRVVDDMNRWPVFGSNIPSPTTTWKDMLDIIFPTGWTITQEWGNDPGGALYDTLYQYGKGHGTNGRTHTGLDVGVPYGTRFYSPADGIVRCAGTGNGPGYRNTGCGAFNDWGDQCETLTSKQGVGHIQIEFDNGQALIFGHSRTCAVKVGDRVTRGQLLGTSGGMCGPHIHLEAMRWQNDMWWLFDPKELLEAVSSTTPTPPKTNISIRQRIIPAGNVNRPGTKLNTKPLWIWVHDTGNTKPGANAAMHAEFVRTGGGPETVSFHFVVDDTEAIQLLPLDEIGWHAGDGCDNRTEDIGCFQSVAIETCVNSDGNWERTKKNLTELMAAIIVGDSRINYAGRQGQFSEDRIAQHYRSSGKNCPAKIRAEGSWNDLIAATKRRVTELRGTSTPPPIVVEYAPGIDFGVAEWLFGDRVSGAKLVATGGILSPIYIERCVQDGVWPELIKRKQWDDRVYFQFSNGWVALFNDRDKTIRWLR